LNTEYIFKEVRHILVEELDVDAEDIQPESELVSDIGLSSVEIMNLVFRLEKSFSIRISERLLRTFVTTQDIVNCVYAKLEGKA